jgi:hypothetical protein
VHEFVPISAPIVDNVLKPFDQGLRQCEVLRRPFLVDRLALPAEQIAMTMSMTPILMHDWNDLLRDFCFVLSDKIDDPSMIGDDSHTKHVPRSFDRRVQHQFVGHKGHLELPLRLNGGPTPRTPHPA